MIVSVFEQMLLALPLVAGATVSISLMKLPDLSLESAYLFGAVTAAVIPLGYGSSLAVAVASAMAGGAAVGLVSASMNQLLKIPFLLASIITNGLFHGIVQLVMGSALVSFKERAAPLEVEIPGGEVMILAVIGVGVIIALSALLRSEMGYAFAVYGNNPSFFQHHGVSTRAVVISGVIVADALAGLGGFLFSTSNGFVDLTMGNGVVLLCLTALMLSKIVKPTRCQGIVATLAGLFATFVVQQLLLNAGIDLRYFNAVQAVFILAALTAFGDSRANTSAIDHLGV